MKKNTTTSQIVSMPKVNGKNKTNGEYKTNGKTNGLSEGARTFETRFIPRYKTIPQMPEGLPEPTFSESSNKILKERYLLKGGNLEIVETVAERFWHIAYDIASGDFDFSPAPSGAGSKHVLDLAQEFYTVMVKQEFLPNSPTIMNAGKQNGLQYSACFVLPVGDSLPEIFDSIKYAALIHQTGGGTGFAFSRLRPAGSIVNTTGGVASGPVSFLRVFNAATESIKQGGTRRGANMGILRIDHPDILEFIRCKAELDDLNKPVYEGIAPLLPDDASRDYVKTLLLDKQISNFNISVAITKRFMEALEKGEDYELITPHSGEAVGKLNAKEVFDEIIERAWKTGDPGLIFIDRINDSPANPAPTLETIESTNPCGEQPLAPWDACNLGSINLGKFVLDDGSDLDWERLGRIAGLAVHFLDNVVQTNPYTLKHIYDEVHQNRRIGLGVMGFADMLFKLKVSYDSDEALELAGKIMKFINEKGHEASEILAEERGPFPNWASSIYADKASSAFKSRPESQAYTGGRPIRNSTITTIAPTGTISIIGDCSSGIEPVFALAYIHKAKAAGDQYRTLTIANQTFTDIAKREGFWSEDLGTSVLEHGSVKAVAGVPEEWQKVFVTAPEIDPIWHVKMQAAFQAYTDNGVSKTINLPNSATRDDVRTAYMMAYETGCNGITIYRDGSKSMQVLNVSSSLNGQNPVATVQKDELVPVAERPMILRGRTYKVSTPVGEAFITVNGDGQGQPFEVFVTVGRAGMHTMADAEAMGRLVSLSLRLARGARETDPKAVAAKIVGQLRGIGGASSVGFGKNRVQSLADAIAKVLAEDLALSPQTDMVETIPLNLTIDGNDSAQPVPYTPHSKTNADLCPECGSVSFVMEEGCKKCHSCGYSMC